MAMDNGKSGIMGMFGGGYGSRDPSMNVPCKYLVIPIRLFISRYYLTI